MTLISAPAGYGKTTLVIEWLHSACYPAAWLSLDQNDNDPALFLSYLIAALQRIEPGFGRQMQALTQTPQPPPVQVLLTAMVNEMAAISGDFILVLDD